MTDPSGYDDGTIVAATQPRRSTKVRTIALVAAAVVIVGAAATVATLSLTGSDTPAAVVGAPSTDASSPTSSSTLDPSGTAPTEGLPTAEVLGRNVFAPLVEVTPVGYDDGGTEPAVDTVPTPTTTTPPPSATVTVTAPGPTVTDVRIITETPAPSTVTTTATLPYLVTVAAVADATVADSDATFAVNGQSSTVPKNTAFGGVFVYIGYNPTTTTVSFGYGLTVVSAQVGKTVALQ